MKLVKLCYSTVRRFTVCVGPSQTTCIYCSASVIPPARCPSSVQEGGGSGGSGGARGCINYEETTNDVPAPVFHITNNWDLHILNIRQQFSIHNREISINVNC